MNRAPRSVAQALSDESIDVKIAQVVAQVADDAPSALPAPAPVEYKAQPVEATEPGLVRVRNSHCSSVRGITPGEWGWVTPEDSKRFSWAWR